MTDDEYCALIEDIANAKTAILDNRERIKKAQVAVDKAFESLKHQEERLNDARHAERDAQIWLKELVSKQGAEHIRRKKLAR